MARTAKAAAETLVYYIKLAIGEDDVRGDMHAELQSIIDDFDAIDRELAELKQKAHEPYDFTHLTTRLDNLEGRQNRRSKS